MRFKSDVELIKSHKLGFGILLFIGLFLLTANTFAQDPNFYIFLCFGQSNMEGQGAIENQDKNVDSRFMVMEAVTCSNLRRTKGSWYTATPPLCRCYTKLSPADYFGRTMVENLPDSIRIGVINVSVAGCKIELFDKDTYAAYAATVESWMTSIINEYDGNPYGRLVEMAQLAQQDGVIKGILLHQGESNTGESQWPSKVKKIYNDLMADLSLDPNSVPLLAGEVVNADQGGVCSYMNTIIAKLPLTLSNSYVISSAGCTDQSDNLHFDSAGNRELGKRYAVKMLSLLGTEITDPEEPDTTTTKPVSIYFEPECATIGENWEIVQDAQASNERYVTAKSGFESVASAPSGDANAIYIPFSLDTAGTFYVYARLNCPTYDDDSFWVKMDNGEFAMSNGLVTSGWGWLNLNTYELAKGEHTLSIAYREDGAKLDKICISNNILTPDGMGEDAENLCDPTGVIDLTEMPSDYTLEQNYPNPFNPSTHIDYSLPMNADVSLKIYDTLGADVYTLFEGKQQAGQHSLIWNSVDNNGNAVPSGHYFIRLTVQRDGLMIFQTAKKILLLK